MFRDYSELLTPHSDVTQFTMQLKGFILPTYPLYDFRSDKLYKDNIDFLLNSPNNNHRILAYLVIASSGDSSKENILLTKLKTETEKGNLRWAGMALLYLHTKHTMELFDFLVKNEEFGDAHMLPLYIKLDKDSLLQTAYNKINDEDPTAKMLAVQILSTTQLNPKTESLLKKAIANWDISMKGFAVYAIRELQIGNLLEILKPLIEIPAYKAIVLQALSNSPTESDRKYLLEQVISNDTISVELLECLFKSKNIENLKYWLEILYSKEIPSDYLFFTFEQPLLNSDLILPELQASLKRIDNVKYIAALEEALLDRTDDASIDILISFLKHPDNHVRFCSAMTLEKNSSSRLNDKRIRELILQELKNKH